MTTTLKKCHLFTLVSGLAMAPLAARAQGAQAQPVPRPSVPFHCPSAASNPCGKEALQTLLDGDCRLAPSCASAETSCKEVPTLASKAQRCHQQLLDCAVVDPELQRLSERARQEGEACQVERQVRCEPPPRPSGRIQ